MIRSIDIAWAAGFLEGEGSFTKAKPSGPTNPNGSINIIAAQVQLEPLERLHALFGGRLYRYQKPRKAHWSTINTWRANGARAAAIMMTLYVFMSPKRRAQIEAALVSWRKLPFPKSAKDAPYRPFNKLHELVRADCVADPQVSDRALAKRYGLSRGHIWNIRRNPAYQDERRKAGGAVA